MNTLEENIVSKVRSELDNMMTAVETRVQDAVLTAIENLVIPGVELAMKSTNAASAGRSVDGNVLNLDQRDFSGNVEGLQMTASGRIRSRTDLNMIYETRGNITVEEGDLVVNEKNIDRQSHTHHIHYVYSARVSKSKYSDNFYFFFNPCQLKNLIGFQWFTLMINL